MARPACANAWRRASRPSLGAFDDDGALRMLSRMEESSSRSMMLARRIIDIEVKKQRQEAPSSSSSHGFGPRRLHSRHRQPARDCEQGGGSRRLARRNAATNFTTNTANLSRRPFFLPLSLPRTHTFAAMSWQGYIDNQLLGTKSISQAAILGIKGGVWAASPGFTVGTPKADEASSRRPKLIAASSIAHSISSPSRLAFAGHTAGADCPRQGL